MTLRIRHLAAAGRSIDDIVRAAGYKTRILPKVPILDSINAARTIFPSCWFDREHAAEGINCLRHYRYEVDPVHRAVQPQPIA
jgi:phage terminase large subunit